MCDAMLTQSGGESEDEKFESLKSKLTKAKQIQQKIKKLRSSPNYLELDDLETR